MRGYRGILSCVTAAALLGAALLAVAALLWPRLPDPAVADRQGLLRWLVTRDLNAESAETRRTLARRLEEEFHKGFDVDTAEGLEPAQRKQLWDNIVLLLEPWFMDKTDRYFQLETAQRNAYLDELIDMMTAWRDVDALRPQEAAAADSPAEAGALLSALFDQVTKWQERAEPQRREQIQQFLLAVQMRWLIRGFQRAAPSLP